MKIIQIQIPNHIAPEEKGWPEDNFEGYIAWADTKFPTNTILSEISTKFNSTYRLIEVLDESKNLERR